MQSNSTHYEAALLGLGAMGAALARAALAGGRRVIVWNRTAARAEPLVGAGATLAASAAAAVEAAAVVIVCVTDYAATLSLLADIDLRGKTLVQLSTGTPQEARALAAWAAGRGAQYLDGAIVAVPSQIGGENATILASGSEAAYAAAEPLLRTTAAVRFVGSGSGTAAALDLGVLSTLFGALLGFYQGARVIESEQLPVDGLGAMLVAIMPAIGEMIRNDAEAIHHGRYAAPESSLEICWRSMELLTRQAAEAAIDASFARFAAGQLYRGVAAGFGDESPAAMIKVLRAASAQKGAGA
ncbi:NAD(P)-binding domain-containing protein [Nannocystis pusilla]|uniref:NAD(P)-binding domain-containing protein n=2 Tax=Nannocystis pusilla TaxID=889268 RepID=A0ABS7TP95_9BACT|nr:NAD(P)-binding domain-containing protein [Nannocystis pusilla]